jgi:hypothetical protein
VTGRQQYTDIKQQLWTCANPFMFRLSILTLQP